MPELEELVKKNPNRLIGCGGWLRYANQE
jgi:hypothetical protein